MYNRMYGDDTRQGITRMNSSENVGHDTEQTSNGLKPKRAANKLEVVGQSLQLLTSCKQPIF